MRPSRFILLVLLWAPPTLLQGAPAGGAHTWRSVAEWYADIFGELHGLTADTEQSELRVRSGDDPHWALPNYDDSAWAVADRDNVVRKNAGFFWIRLRTRSNHPGQSLPTGFLVIETAASEIFWDGVLVRRCGRPASDRAHELPGPIYSLFDLPGSAMGPGEHLIALRMSTHRFNRPEPTTNIVVSNVEMGAMTRLLLQQMTVPMLGVGALAFFGLAALVFWLTLGRPKGLLLFAGLNLGGAITHFSIHVRSLFPVPYSWSFPVWTATEVLVAMTATCLVGLVLVQFELPRRGWFTAAFVGLQAADGLRLALVYHMIEPIKGMVDSWRAAFLCSIALLIWAAVRRRRGAGYVLAAVVLASLWFEHDTEEFLSEIFLLAMLPILLSFILVIGLNLSAEQRLAREARLTAARLELELLRKSLQPHFLMNTLTAVSQAMEENHQSAANLIDDLAEELRELAQFAEHKEVTLERELELCRAHLRVMSVRTEKPWRLEVGRIEPEALVPPALFFTLIENSFTHQQPIAGATAFRLRSETIASGVRYVFFAPGKVRTSPFRPTGGSGLRYVKARLNECWPGGWDFHHGPIDGGWETTVALRRERGRSAP